MSRHASIERPDTRHDGFGSRRYMEDAQFGRVEVLELSAALGTQIAEQPIRARAARLAEANVPALARVVRITREAQALSITSTAPEGVTLGDLLAALEFGTVTLSDHAILELANATVQAVAELHQTSASAAHGALSPTHILVRLDGSVALAGAVFGDVLQSLQWNREQLWRVFGVALPPSASLPRFDQRADVTQLGALVLAMLLRRSLTATEYPRGIIDLVAAAVDGMAVGGSARSALRMWLQQALQLHPKAMFASAADASRVLTEVVTGLAGRRAGAVLLQSVIRRMAGDEVLDEVAARAPELRQPARLPMPVAAAAAAKPAAMPARGLAFLRNVFPVLRAN